MYVVTADQRGSRTADDRVEELLSSLAESVDALRSFERTAGDEVQGVLDDPHVVLDVTLGLLRDSGWTIGVGVGPVRQPLPASTRAGAGAAFTFARDAVTRAKTRHSRAAVTGADEPSARRAQTALDLLAGIYRRRSPAGWEAVDLAIEGLSGIEIASRLGITKQAASQRLTVAEWPVESDARELAAHLLAEADATASMATAVRRLSEQRGKVGS